MSASEATGAQTYALLVHRVRWALDILFERKTHPFFIAYLHLRRRAGELNRTTGISPEWNRLGSLLETPGGPPGKPYLRPFWNQTRTAHQEWLNENLAGSYAPSSIREVAAKVVEVGADGSFNLREGHAELALANFLYGDRMPALPLAAFLFRNHGFVADERPGPANLVAIFRDKFGYGLASEEEFRTLFDATLPDDDGHWTEPLPTL